MSTSTRPYGEALTTITDMTKIAFLGPQGTFTEQALLDFIAAGHAPADAEPIAVDSPRKALDAVREGTCDYAVVALESSVDGPVTHTEDALVDGSPLQILHETLVPIQFAIAARPQSVSDPTKLTSAITSFTTHPVAEAQVRHWMSAHLPHAAFLPASSNAAAARAVSEGKADAAACPRRAAELYGLDVVADGVADMRNARTRFVLVGRPHPPTAPTGDDRTGLVFTLPNEPGALLNALTELSIRGVDMSRISSRPIRGKVDAYVFHIGVVGHIEDDAVAEAMAGLHRRTEWVRYLGSWPRARAASEPDDAGTAPPDYAESRQWVARSKGNL